MNKPLICLLIDDDTDDHEIFLLALQNVDPPVTCIIEKDAKIALEKLKHFLIHPDFVFVDMNMPKMSGKEFIIEMRKLEHLKHVQLVAYSSSALEKDQLLKLGASKFLTKPTNIPLLEKALNSCFRPQAA